MRNAPIYTDFSVQAINAAFNVACHASWAMGVWMYDVKKEDCVFYPLQKNAHCGNNGPFKTKNKKHNAKLAKNIIIDMVTTSATHVLVEWTAPGLTENQHLEINRFGFEQWLYETCRLDWCLHELSSHQSEDNSSMSTDNYWLYGDYGVQYSDVVTYIVEHRLALINCG
jgi:hypothetical protein